MYVPPPFSYQEIDAVLRELVRQLPRRPGWYARLERLSPSATAERRLPLYQAARDDGCLPDDAGLFLVSYVVSDLALDFSRELQRINEELAKEMDEHPERFYADVDDDSFDDDFPCDDDDAPANDGYQSDLDEWLVLRRDYPLGPPLPPGEEIPAILRKYQWAMWDRAFFKRLKEHGEPEIALLFQRHAPEFNRRYENGRRYFFASPEARPADRFQAMIAYAAALAAKLVARIPE